MDAPKPTRSFDDVIRTDGRYPPEAYGFLQEGFDRAVLDAHGKPPVPNTPRHVSGQQICQSLRQLAIERWGLMSRTVLARWNITATGDFGNMVYLLIENHYMSKTEEDSLDDFCDVYDFADAFIRPEFDLKE